MREWLSWWSATLPRSRPRVRVPSRALKKEVHPKGWTSFFDPEGVRTPHKMLGSRSPFHFGPRRTEVHWTSCAVSRLIKNKNQSKDWFLFLFVNMRIIISKPFQIIIQIGTKPERSQDE